MSMNEEPIKKIEKILSRIFVFLGVVAVVGVILIIRSSNGRMEAQVSTEEKADYTWEAGLADSTIWLPDYCELYEKIPDVTFYDAKGGEHHISEFQGKPTVVVFWASWCEDCQEQMPFMNQYQEAVKKYGDINFVFINKTDGEKETMEFADNYIKEHNINGNFFYDTQLTADNLLGLHNIPTTILLDSQGIIQSWMPKQIKDQNVFEALVLNTVKGSGAVTAEFIMEHMMDEAGGIHSLYDRNAAKTEESDVLSESQGAMLEYAVLAENKELFDLVLSYITENMLENGLISWTVGENGASDVNALIDDLRIYSSLLEAQKLWGGYEEKRLLYEENLLRYGMNKDKFVDFYDSKNKAYANRFTLCYGDLKTMKRLGEDNAAFTQAYLQVMQIVVNGQISERFPLYYSWYNYQNTNYEDTELNSAEAMVTLLHLAEVNKLPNNTIQWLKESLQGDGIKARYTVKGKVVKGYNFDSTAVYALVAMIGEEIGDTQLRGMALRKMEKMHITDVSLPYNGAFGLEDGTSIMSFDQIMSLLAYEYVLEGGN